MIDPEFAAAIAAAFQDFNQRRFAVTAASPGIRPDR